LGQLVELVYEPSERNAFRIEQASLLFSLQRVGEAEARLQEVLDEDPDNLVATQALFELYQTTGQNNELARLLERQLDVAIARKDPSAIEDLAGRLGALLSPERRDDAMEVYRQALGAVPQSRMLLRALVGLSEASDEPRERAEIMDRLLPLEDSENALSLTTELLSLWEQLGETARQETTLERAFALCPQEISLRVLLEQRYTQQQSWEKMVTMLLFEAEARASDPVASLVALQRAAAMVRDKLQDPVRAVEIMQRARVLAPDDINLLGDLAESLISSSRYEEAMRELSVALADDALDQSSRLTLLCLRAQLYLAIDDSESAVADLENAYSSNQAAIIGSKLVQALESRLTQIHQQSDTAVERRVLLRLQEVLILLNEKERARALIVQWVEHHPTDTAALWAVAQIDESVEQWERAAGAYQRLAQIEEGPAQAEAAIRLLQTCVRAGYPAEARIGVELACERMPFNEELRKSRRQLYELINAYRELAALHIEDSRNVDNDQSRYDLLRLAGEQLFHHESDANAAIYPLEQALIVRPGDHDVTILLADSYTLSGHLGQATSLLEQAIALHKGRRSRELSFLQHRMARVAYASGDRNVELAWLNAALEADMQSAHVAAELAEVAILLEQYDVAMKALRAIVLIKTPGPMSRAMAYLQQAKILYQQEDPRRAVVLARKALSEDPNFEEATAFLNDVKSKGVSLVFAARSMRCPTPQRKA